MSRPQILAKNHDHVCLCYKCYCCCIFFQFQFIRNTFIKSVLVRVSFLSRYFSGSRCTGGEKGCDGESGTVAGGWYRYMWALRERHRPCPPGRAGPAASGWRSAPGRVHPPWPAARTARQMRAARATHQPIKSPLWTGHLIFHVAYLYHLSSTKSSSYKCFPCHPLLLYVG